MPKESQIKQFSQELTESISYIQRMARILLRERSDALIQGKVTMPQYLSLELLSNHGVLKMKDIAKALNISLPAATGLVNRLVKMKLVERVYDQEDRRVIFVELTSEGKKTTDETKLARRKIIEEMFGGITDEEREIYIRIIRKVKSNLNEKAK
ncbi:MAG: MarR family transcriptional regulator [Candidatus Omnitrophica bacterium]|nr:MarR family transcriptional regulator [Candidatus Omnitrophota bacterium]